MKTLLLTSVFALLLSASVLAEEPLPGDSIYHLQDAWKDQHSQPLKLAQLRGKKQVIAMVYTECPHTCPVMVSALKTLQAQLPESQRDDIGFVLVSLTPDIDTPEKLRKFSQSRKLDEQWRLLNGSPASVRNLAMALGIKYKMEADGEVSHSNQFTILDADGRVLLQEVGSDEAAKAAAKRIATTE